MILSFLEANALFEKYGVHLVLRNQDEVYAMEKILSRPQGQRKTPTQVKQEAVKVGMLHRAAIHTKITVELDENVEEVLKSVLL